MKLLRELTEKYKAYKAYKIARKAHEGQIDKGGKPYINHPLTVAKNVKGHEEKIVALLHDVVEDSSYSLEDIKSFGFSENVVKSIECLTRDKDKDEDYDNYIERILSNPIAVKVKIADMEHNSDLSRIPLITEEIRQRVKKYEHYLKVLSKAETP